LLGLFQVTFVTIKQQSNIHIDHHLINFFVSLVVRLTEPNSLFNLDISLTRPAFKLYQHPLE